MVKKINQEQMENTAALALLKLALDHNAIIVAQAAISAGNIKTPEAAKEFIDWLDGVNEQYQKELKKVIENTEKELIKRATQ